MLKALELRPNWEQLCFVLRSSLEMLVCCLSTSDMVLGGIVKLICCHITVLPCWIIKFSLECFYVLA